jgi:hypothetical protein
MYSNDLIDIAEKTGGQIDKQSTETGENATEGLPGTTKSA